MFPAQGFSVLHTLEHTLISLFGLIFDCLLPVRNPNDFYANGLIWFEKRVSCSSRMPSWPELMSGKEGGKEKGKENEGGVEKKEELWQ